MYLSSGRIIDAIAARIAGPMSARFILGPVIAVVLGTRDGIADARAGTPPFIYDLVVHPRGRARDLRGAFKSLLIPLLVATVLDGIVQYMLFEHVRPGAAVLVGSCVMGLPYALARGVSNRIASARRRARTNG
jgi:hypothetical protein